MYVISDIHGCYDQLKELYLKIKAHSKSKDEIVCVGDYIDRGPKSEDVVEFLMERQANDSDFTWFCLAGNHEDMLLNHRGGFYMNGGMQTLASYGVEMIEDIRPDHMNWYKRLLTYYVNGNVAVAHAGILDRTECADNSKEFLLWDRSLRTYPHGIYKFTVHGHTPMKDVLINENVAYIDTGCVFGGKLTALYIPDTISPDHNVMEILQV